jgi:uncharacterized lipoprotein YddW (UPF0748 family)
MMKRSGQHTLLVATIGSLLIGLVSALFAPAGVQAAPYAEPTVVAADGARETIAAVDPPSRTNGMLALYTPAFGPSTKTNQFGAEAVLVKTGQPNQYRVVDVCTVFDTSVVINPPRCSNAGNNTIPADGAVLSASPGATPDVRRFIKDHFKIGDLVSVYIPVRRTATRTLDAIDPTPQTNLAGVDPKSGQCYPGCRGANQFIMYTPAFGERTGTNDFGYEVTVVGGRVVARGGNNSLIPDNGFVLSGHGSAGSWLAANTILGAAVTVNGTVVTITIDPSAYIFNAQQAIDRAKAALQAARAECRDVPYRDAQTAIDEAQALLKQAQAALDGGDDQGAIDAATAAQSRASVASYRTIESRTVEGRGIWVRPTETTRAAIEQTLDQLQQAGINIVFLETFYQGYTIFPSATATKYGIAAQRPQFSGIDPLQIWLEAAHARNIELHAWVEDFYVGNDALGAPGPILSVHPEWAAVEREDVGKQGPQPSGQEQGYYFLDPAIPEARQYLTELYSEMLSRYAVDGLHLDYIRYPVSLPLANSFSYSDYSRQAFQAQYGVDPYTLTPDANPDQWAQWVAWRQNNITTFVEQVRGLIDTLRPDAALSAAVFPNEFESKIKKMQDWELWAQRGYMDFLTGMSFGRSVESVAADTAAMLEAVDGKALIYTGIYAPFNGLSAETMVAQIEAIRAAGGHGIALFDWVHVTQEQAEALREGPFRQPADAPHSRPALAVRTGLQDLERRIDTLYVPQGCVDRRTAKPLGNRIDEIMRALQRADSEQGDQRAAIGHAQRRLDDLNKLLQNKPINSALAERLQAEIELYRSILSYMLAHL